MRARILDAAARTARCTVPEIAEAIGAPTHEVVFWVMGMRRYGWLVEIKGHTVDGYFQYEPTGRGPMTAHRLDPCRRPGLYADLQRFGATDVSACFSCGTCTASCPLSWTAMATFPRRIIRYAQVGMKDRCSPARSCGPATSAPSAPTPAPRGPGPASSWPPPAATPSPATTGPTSPGRCTCSRSWHGHRAGAGRVLRAVHVRGPRAAGRDEPWRSSSSSRAG